MSSERHLRNTWLSLIFGSLNYNDMVYYRYIFIKYELRNELLEVHSNNCFHKGKQTSGLHNFYGNTPGHLNIYRRLKQQTHRPRSNIIMVRYTFWNNSGLLFVLFKFSQIRLQIKLFCLFQPFVKTFSHPECCRGNRLR